VTILYLATNPEQLDIETALERSIAQSKAKKAAEAARSVDAKRWLRDVVQSVRDERANVDKKRAALADAQKGDFKNVASLFVVQHAQGDLIEAQDRLNLSLTEHFTITNGRNSK